METDLDSYYVQIKAITLAAHEAGRPVLIFFKDNSALEGYYNSGDHLPVPPQKRDQMLLVINQKTRDITDAVRRATRKGQISLIEKSFGRGTDFICLDKEINAKGGVLVLQTFFSLDKSEEIQIRGRTARQSREGEYKLVMLAQHLVEDLFLTLDEIGEQKKAISQMYSFLDKKREVVWGQ